TRRVVRAREVPDGTWSAEIRASNPAVLTRCDHLGTGPGPGRHAVVAIDFGRINSYRGRTRTYAEATQRRNRKGNSEYNSLARRPGGVAFPASRRSRRFSSNRIGNVTPAWHPDHGAPS